MAIIAAGLMERDGLAFIFGAFVGMLGSIDVILMLGGVWIALKAIVGL